MEKKDYERLNGYLNEIFLALKDEDQFLIKNIEPISRLNDEYLSFISQYELSDDIKENKLTYMDVYLFAREIIASIDKSYLSEYDDLIKSGRLDFGYEDEYDDSMFSYEGNLIDISREFNYNDVLALIHEFIHYTNGKDKRSQNRYLLTEYLSIYFEIYALDYLMQRGIPKDEIGIYDRLISATEGAESLYNYEIIFLAYEKFGDINEDTINYLNKYYMPMPKEDFDEECENLLECIEKEEDVYRNSIMYEKEFEMKEFIYELCTPFFDDYRYFLGTLMAYYAREHCKIEDIIYLNNHINDDDIGCLDLVHLLKKVGIDIEKSDFINQALSSIENYIKEYSNEKSR